MFDLSLDRQIQNIKMLAPLLNEFLVSDKIVASKSIILKTKINIIWNFS